MCPPFFRRHDVCRRYGLGPASPALAKGAMTKRLYVGNLPYTTDEMTLRDLFSQYGQVESVQIATDRETGRSRGFAFVDMATDADAQAAIQGLSGYQMNGRPLTIEEARPREAAGARGFGRGGYR